MDAEIKEAFEGQQKAFEIFRVLGRVADAFRANRGAAHNNAALQTAINMRGVLITGTEQDALRYKIQRYILPIAAVKVRHYDGPIVMDQYAVRELAEMAALLMSICEGIVQRHTSVQERLGAAETTLAAVAGAADVLCKKILESYESVNDVPFGPEVSALLNVLEGTN